MMLEHQIDLMMHGKGFIAALDQSGGSTPKALAAYGVDETAYESEEEMYTVVHDMRKRIITSPAFTDERILGAILFENTMDRKIDGKYTADYLQDEKKILPFLKVDIGLEEKKNGVQMMKEIPHLDELLIKANERHIFGTKMRSVIHEANEEGIREVVKQQFWMAKRIIGFGLIPIVEPEVDIHSPEKAAIEKILLKEIEKELAALMDDVQVILKLTIPTETNLYSSLINHANVIRVVALSGGYPAEKANELLAQNKGMIASFSRALTENLRTSQSDDEFNETLKQSIEQIYEASIT